MSTYQRMTATLAEWMADEAEDKSILICLELDGRTWINLDTFEAFDGGFKLSGKHWSGFSGYREELVCKEADLVAIRRREDTSIRDLFGKSAIADADDQIPF